MSSPFFSIIIPTKNRNWVVNEAILSILRQSHSEWELIVVDNDDTEATAEVCRQHADPRIKHLRTGGLSMADNWERGLEAATGRYVTYLQDKNCLRQHALRRAEEALRDCGAEFMAWKADCIIDNETPARLARARVTRTLGSRESVDVLADIVGRMDGKGFMPFPNYGFICRELLARILGAPPSRLCLGLDPALGAALQILASTDRVALLDEAWFVHGHNHLSNGKSVENQGKTFKSFNKDSGVTDSIYHDRVPVKTVTVINAAYNEYLRIREILGPDRLPPLDLPAYFCTVYEAIWKIRGPCAAMRRHCQRWQEALAGQDEMVRERVRQGLKSHPMPWLA